MSECQEVVSFVETNENVESLDKQKMENLIVNFGYFSNYPILMVLCSIKINRNAESLAPCCVSLKYFIALIHLT